MFSGDDSGTSGAGGAAGVVLVVVAVLVPAAVADLEADLAAVPVVVADAAGGGGGSAEGGKKSLGIADTASGPRAENAIATVSAKLEGSRSRGTCGRGGIIWVSKASHSGKLKLSGGGGASSILKYDVRE
jgi:hypothetical protein